MGRLSSEISPRSATLRCPRVDVDWSTDPNHVRRAEHEKLWCASCDWDSPFELLRRAAEFVAGCGKRSPAQPIAMSNSVLGSGTAVGGFFPAIDCECNPGSIPANALLNEFFQ